ncbi:MAG: hypothetical protein MUP63_03245 [Candidatus Nanohaloarchaeota archaeon QJJ-7]|nr:hypothetical protein [Candidatus Nanohaloarchaeota archaeon QJJ-7]
MEPEEVIRKIEEVEIQGATAVAERGIELLKELEDEGREGEIEDYRQELRDARPTEPLLFNALDISKDRGYGPVLEHIRDAKEMIVENGSGLVEDGDVIYTHCHSSTVTSVLKEAFGEKDFEVHATETRPLYQGRTTAEELSKEGIPVTFHIDSGALNALEEADRMFIGSDAFLPSGGAINKIGSKLFAEAAEKRGVPVNVFVDSWKLDPEGRFEKEENIEERPSEEVWADAPGGVRVSNPAFEKVDAELIDAVVSELGVHGPNRFIDAVRDSYPEVLR